MREMSMSPICLFPRPCSSYSASPWHMGSCNTQIIRELLLTEELSPFFSDTCDHSLQDSLIRVWLTQVRDKYWQLVLGQNAGQLSADLVFLILFFWGYFSDLRIVYSHSQHLLHFCFASSAAPVTIYPALCLL